MNEKFPELQVSWKEGYSLPFVVTIENKITQFQYKILNNIVFANAKIFRLKIIDSPLCVFCKGEVESLEHLLLISFVRLQRCSGELSALGLLNAKIELSP